MWENIYVSVLYPGYFVETCLSVLLFFEGLFIAFAYWKQNVFFFAFLFQDETLSRTVQIYLLMAAPVINWNKIDKDAQFFCSETAPLVFFVYQLDLHLKTVVRSF